MNGLVNKMGNKKSSHGFIMQAGVLVMAGVIVKILGLLYRSPLTAIIGDEGNGYYGAAFNIYLIILTISSYSIPTAISKVVSQRLALKEYGNAQKVFRCALYYVAVVGTIASMILFFGADFLVEENSAKVLRVFAPTIILYGFLGVLRGYFQAHRTMVQTSVSQILEQLLNATVSVGVAYLLTNSVKNSDATTRAVYGAIGSALGTGSGVVIALLFMSCVYLLNYKGIHKRIKRDRTKNKETYGEIMKVILLMVTPIILSSFIYNASTAFNQTVFVKIFMHVKGLPESEVSKMYGIFSQKSVVLANIPIAMGAAMSSAMIPMVSGAYAKGEIKEINQRVASGIRTTMLMSIPAVVGLAVLAKPIVLLLFPQKESLEMASNLLRGLSITVIFYQISTISNGVLQGIGKVNKPVVNASISLAIQSAVLIPLLLFTDLGLYSLVIATVVYSFSICVLNQFGVRKYIGYRQEFLRTFMVPIAAAAFMGAVAFGVYQGLYYFSGSNIVSLLVSIMASVIVYFPAIIKIGGVGETELRALPKGHLIVRVSKKVKLIP